MVDRLLASKYQLVRQIARGSMGSIWSAEHTLLRLPVAVKFIQLSEGAGGYTPLAWAEATQRFLAEARIAVAARSPHVVQVFDYGVEQGTPYLVMELLEGESLAERLGKLGCLGAEETAVISLQVARALERMHEVGIVHRDLKPENIFLVGGDELWVKILDFGVARVSDQALLSTLTPGTRTGDLVGTPSYMSPEQLQDPRSLDERSDVWALGVVAFECLVGRVPFIAPHIAGIILAICARPLPVPSLLGAVPRGFDNWFARACARDLDLRFPTAKEAAAALYQLCVPAPALQAADSEPLPSGIQRLWTGLFRRPGARGLAAARRVRARR